MTAKKKKLVGNLSRQFQLAPTILKNEKSCQDSAKWTLSKQDTTAVLLKFLHFTTFLKNLYWTRIDFP